MRLALATSLAILLGGCDFLEDSSKRPWIGYAWHKTDDKPQWFFSDFETLRDCMEMMRHNVKEWPNSQWYPDTR